ncbi:MAG: hypothetical protein ACLTYW_04045 [Collinsella sp.]
MPPCASWGIAPILPVDRCAGKFKTVGVAMFNITGTGNLDRMEGFAAAAETRLCHHPH